MSRIVRIEHTRRGSALVPALLVVVAVATMGLVWLQLGLSRNREQNNAVETKRAFYLAEAGLAEGYYGLVSGMSGNVASEVLPARFANGLFWTSCEDDGDGRYSLKSTGLCGGGRSTLSITVEKQASSIATLGVFADRGLTVQADTLIDSYDSRDGEYSPPVLALDGPLPSGARCGSNGDVAIYGGTPPAKVYGDARPGPGMTVLRGFGVVIAGSTAPSEATNTLPPIEVPTLESEGSRATTARARVITLPTGEHKYDALTVLRGGQLVINGPATIVVDRLSVAALGTLLIQAESGPVELHVTDWLDLKSGSTLTSTSTDTRAVSLLVSASTTLDRDGDGADDAPVRFEAGGAFHGKIYSPAAPITTSAALELFGAIAASELTVAAGTRIHFDRALLDGSLDEAALPELIGWRIVELPSIRVVSLHYDPLFVLRRAGLSPPLARDAHLARGVAQATETVRRRGGSL